MRPKTGGGKATVLAPEGRHHFRFLSLIMLGTVTDKKFTYEKGPNKGKFVQKEEVKLIFELVNTNHVFDEAKGKQPFILSKTFTFSTNEKANMRKFFESWKGKKYTEDDIAKFDMMNWFNSQFAGECVVAHETSKKGKAFAVIHSVMALDKEERTKVKKLRNPQVCFRFDDEDTWPAFANLFSWDKERIQESEEWKKLGKKILAVCPEEEEAEGSSEEEDDEPAVDYSVPEGEDDAPY